MDIKDLKLGTNVIIIPGNKVNINISKIGSDYINGYLEGHPISAGIRISKDTVKEWMKPKETINEGNNKRKSNSTSKS